MSALDEFINQDEPGGPDPLIKLALIHHQFEAIHPFLDGNGRTGRILIALYLVQQNLIPQPVLYLSRYINFYKQDYYRLLRLVTETGCLERVDYIYPDGYWRNGSTDNGQKSGECCN